MSIPQHLLRHKMSSDSLPKIETFLSSRPSTLSSTFLPVLQDFYLQWCNLITDSPSWTTSHSSLLAFLLRKMYMIWSEVYLSKKLDGKRVTLSYVWKETIDAFYPAPSSSTSIPSSSTSAPSSSQSSSITQNTEKTNVEWSTLPKSLRKKIMPLIDQIYLYLIALKVYEDKGFFHRDFLDAF